MRRLLLTVPLVLAASHAFAWPEALLQALARDARRLVPVSLARLLAEREDKVFAAARMFPGEVGQALAADLAAGRLQPETVAALDAQGKQVVDLVRERRLSEGIARLGALARIAGDLSDPVLSVGPRGYPPGVAREYYAFVQESLTKIPVVLDDEKALALKRRDLPSYWQQVLDHSRGQSDVLETELFQNGRLVDHRTLDYRSPVFGVASLSYSRAVTAIAATWLVYWRESRGDTTRIRSPIEVRPQEFPPSAPAPRPSGTPHPSSGGLKP